MSLLLLPWLASALANLQSTFVMLISNPQILTLFIPRGPLFWAKNLQEQTSLFLVKTTNNVFLQPPLTDNPVSEHYFETSQGVNNLCIVAMSPTG